MMRSARWISCSRGMAPRLVSSEFRQKRVSLIAHVTGFQAAAVTQHQVGLQCVVGLGDVGAGTPGCRGRPSRWCPGVTDVAAFATAWVLTSITPEAAPAGASGATVSAAATTGGSPVRCSGRSSAARRIDLSEVARDGLGCRLEHHGLQAMEVLLLQTGLDGVALVQAQANRPGALGAVALHLLQSVLQNLQRLQAHCRSTRWCCTCWALSRSACTWATSWRLPM